MDSRRVGVTCSLAAHVCRRVGALALAVALALSVTGVAAAAATTNATSVGTEQTFGGFTLGAAVLAVLVGGTYWYYRR